MRRVESFLPRDIILMLCTEVTGLRDISRSLETQGTTVMDNSPKDGLYNDSLTIKKKILIRDFVFTKD